MRFGFIRGPFNKSIIQVVGWYRTGSLLPRNEDETITKTMHEHKEATILLKVWFIKTQ